MKKWKHNFREFVFKGNHTIQEIASQTGISAPVLYAMNRDPYYNLTKDTIGKLCTFFKCEPGDLIVSENSNYSTSEKQPSGMLKEDKSLEYFLKSLSGDKRDVIVKFCRHLTEMLESDIEL